MSDIKQKLTNLKLESQKLRKQLPKISKKRTLPKSVRPEEWDLLIKIIPKKDKKAILSFLLAYGSGLRISEIVGSEKNNKIKPLDKTNFRGNGIFIHGKYDVERIVPIPKGWKNSFTQMLPIKTTSRTLERKFKKYAALSKLNPKYTFHSLRHGFATRCLENGMSINQVSLALGHSDIKTTSIYTKASPQDLLKSYEKVF